VTSSSEEKIKQAVRLGAKRGLLHAPAEGYAERLAQVGPFDLAIDSAGGDGFNEVASALVTGGRLVFFGGTAGNIPEFKLRPAFWGHLTLLGTTMGSPRDFSGLLNFVTTHELKPTVDRIFPFADLEEAFVRMAGGEGIGKYVLDMHR
jgi:NADPH:quinone reductase-like Zn-dependent oxidoreductase